MEGERGASWEHGAAPPPPQQQQQGSGGSEAASLGRGSRPSPRTPRGRAPPRRRSPGRARHTGPACLGAGRSYPSPCGVQAQGKARTSTRFSAQLDWSQGPGGRWQPRWEAGLQGSSSPCTSTQLEPGPWYTHQPTTAAAGAGANAPPAHLPVPLHDAARRDPIAGEPHGQLPAAVVVGPAHTAEESPERRHRERALVSAAQHHATCTWFMEKGKHRECLGMWVAGVSWAQLTHQGPGKPLMGSTLRPSAQMGIWPMYQ